MASALNSLTSDIGPPVYYSEGFRIIIEHHLGYLRAHPSTNNTSIDVQLAELYARDFYGFLAYKNVPKHLHWIIMRLNGMYSPLEFVGGVTTLLEPNASTIDMLRQQYVQQQKIFN